MKWHSVGRSGELMPAWIMWMAVFFLYIYVCVVVYPVQEEDTTGVEVDGVVDVSLGWGHGGSCVATVAYRVSLHDSI